MNKVDRGHKVLLLIMIVMIMFSAGCSSSDREHGPLSFQLTTNIVSTAGQELSRAYTPYDEGFIYCKDHSIHFLDFETGKSRVICSQPNCKHSDATCSAFLGDVNGRGGFAAYCNGRVYFVVADRDSGDYIFKSMRMDGTDQSVIYRLNFANYKSGEDIFKLNTVSYLKNNLAVIDCLYGVVPDLKDNYGGIAIEYRSLVMIIDMSTGKVLDRFGDGEEYIVVASYLDTILLYRYVFHHEHLESMAMIDQTYPGRFISLDEYNIWYYDNYCPSQEISVYSISDRTIKTVMNEPCLVYRNKYDDSLNYRGTIVPIGIIGDNLYYYKMSEMDYDCEDRDVGYINLVSMDNTVFYTIKNGGPIISGAHFLDSIVDDSKLLFVEYDSLLPDQRKNGDVYTIDLLSAEVEKLYTDIWNIKYRVYGETDDSFIVSIGNNMCYKVLKTDYYKGDFSQMREYPLEIAP